MAAQDIPSPTWRSSVTWRTFRPTGRLTGGPREQARASHGRTRLQNLIGLLGGIEKASLSEQRADRSPNPALITVAVQTRAGASLTEELIEQVRDLVAAVAPSGEVKVVEMSSSPAADAKVKDAPQPAVDPAAGAMRSVRARSRRPIAADYGNLRGPKARAAVGAAGGIDGCRRRWLAPLGELRTSRLARPARVGRRCVSRWTMPAARRMAALSEAHRGEFLAIVIDGRVVCLRKIQAKTAAQIEIDGNFDAHQAQRLLQGLLGPFAGGGEDPGSPPDEEDDQPSPASGGGVF